MDREKYKDLVSQFVPAIQGYGDSVGLKDVFSDYQMVEDKTKVIDGEMYSSSASGALISARVRPEYIGMTTDDMEKDPSKAVSRAYTREIAEVAALYLTQEGDTPENRNKAVDFMKNAVDDLASFDSNSDDNEKFYKRLDAMEHVFFNKQDENLYLGFRDEFNELWKDDDGTKRVIVPLGDRDFNIGSPTGFADDVVWSKIGEGSIIGTLAGNMLAGRHVGGKDMFDAYTSGNLIRSLYNEQIDDLMNYAVNSEGEHVVGTMKTAKFLGMGLGMAERAAVMAMVPHAGLIAGAGYGILKGIVDDGQYGAGLNIKTAPVYLNGVTREGKYRWWNTRAFDLFTYGVSYAAGSALTKNVFGGNMNWFGAGDVIAKGGEGIKTMGAIIGSTVAALAVDTAADTALDFLTYEALSAGGTKFTPMHEGMFREGAFGSVFQQRLMMRMAYGASFGIVRTAKSKFNGNKDYVSTRMYADIINPDKSKKKGWWLGGAITRAFTAIMPNEFDEINNMIKAQPERFGGHDLATAIKSGKMNSRMLASYSVFSEMSKNHLYRMLFKRDKINNNKYVYGLSGKAYYNEQGIANNLIRDIENAANILRDSVIEIETKNDKGLDRTSDEIVDTTKEVFDKMFDVIVQYKDKGDNVKLSKAVGQLINRYLHDPTISAFSNNSEAVQRLKTSLEVSKVNLQKKLAEDGVDEKTMKQSFIDPIMKGIQEVDDPNRNLSDSLKALLLPDDIMTSLLAKIDSIDGVKVHVNREFGDKMNKSIDDAKAMVRDRLNGLSDEDKKKAIEDMPYLDQLIFQDSSALMHASQDIADIVGDKIGSLEDFISIKTKIVRAGEEVLLQYVDSLHDLNKNKDNYKKQDYALHVDQIVNKALHLHAALSQDMDLGKYSKIQKGLSKFHNTEVAESIVKLAKNNAYYKKFMKDNNIKENADAYANFMQYFIHNPMLVRLNRQALGSVLAFSVSSGLETPETIFLKEHNLIPPSREELHGTARAAIAFGLRLGDSEFSQTVSDDDGHSITFKDIDFTELPLLLKQTAIRKTNASEPAEYEQSLGYDMSNSNARKLLLGSILRLANTQFVSTTDGNNDIKYINEMLKKHKINSVKLESIDNEGNIKLTNLNHTESDETIANFAISANSETPISFASERQWDIEVDVRNVPFLLEHNGKVKTHDEIIKDLNKKSGRYRFDTVIEHAVLRNQGNQDGVRGTFFYFNRYELENKIMAYMNDVDPHLKMSEKDQRHFASGMIQNTLLPRYYQPQIDAALKGSKLDIGISGSRSVVSKVNRVIPFKQMQMVDMSIGFDIEDKGKVKIFTDTMKSLGMHFVQFSGANKRMTFAKLPFDMSNPDEAVYNMKDVLVDVIKAKAKLNSNHLGKGVTGDDVYSKMLENPAKDPDTDASVLKEIETIMTGNAGNLEEASRKALIRIGNFMIKHQEAAIDKQIKRFNSDYSKPNVDGDTAIVKDLPPLPDTTGFEARTKKAIERVEGILSIFKEELDPDNDEGAIKKFSEDAAGVVDELISEAEKIRDGNESTDPVGLKFNELFSSIIGQLSSIDTKNAGGKAISKTLGSIIEVLRDTNTNIDRVKEYIGETRDRWATIDALARNQNLFKTKDAVAITAMLHEADIAEKIKAGVERLQEQGKDGDSAVANLLEFFLVDDLFFTGTANERTKRINGRQNFGSHLDKDLNINKYVDDAVDRLADISKDNGNNGKVRVALMVNPEVDGIELNAGMIWLNKTMYDMNTSVAGLKPGQGSKTIMNLPGFMHKHNSVLMESLFDHLPEETSRSLDVDTDMVIPIEGLKHVNDYFLDLIKIDEAKNLNINGKDHGGILYVEFDLKDPNSDDYRKYKKLLSSFTVHSNTDSRFQEVGNDMSGAASDDLAPFMTNLMNGKAINDSVKDFLDSSPDGTKFRSYILEMLKLVGSRPKTKTGMYLNLHSQGRVNTNRGDLLKRKADKDGTFSMNIKIGDKTINRKLGYTTIWSGESIYDYTRSIYNAPTSSRDDKIKQILDEHKVYINGTSQDKIDSAKFQKDMNKMLEYLVKEKQIIKLKDADGEDLYFHRMTRSPVDHPGQTALAAIIGIRRYGTHFGIEGNDSYIKYVQGGDFDGDKVLINPININDVKGVLGGSNVSDSIALESIVKHWEKAYKTNQYGGSLGFKSDYNRGATQENHSKYQALTGSTISATTIAGQFSSQINYGGAQYVKSISIGEAGFTEDSMQPMKKSLVTIKMHGHNDDTRDTLVLFETGESKGFDEHTKYHGAIDPAKSELSDEVTIKFKDKSKRTFRILSFNTDRGNNVFLLEADGKNHGYRVHTSVATSTPAAIMPTRGKLNELMLQFKNTFVSGELNDMGVIDSFYKVSTGVGLEDLSKRSPSDVDIMNRLYSMQELVKAPVDRLLNGTALLSGNIVYNAYKKLRIGTPNGIQRQLTGISVSDAKSGGGETLLKLYDNDLGKVNGDMRDGIIKIHIASKYKINSLVPTPEGIKTLVGDIIYTYENDQHYGKVGVENQFFNTGIKGMGSTDIINSIFESAIAPKSNRLGLQEFTDVVKLSSGKLSGLPGVQKLNEIWRTFGNKKLYNHKDYYKARSPYVYNALEFYDGAMKSKAFANNEDYINDVFKKMVVDPENLDTRLLSKEGDDKLYLPDKDEYISADILNNLMHSVINVFPVDTNKRSIVFDFAKRTMLNWNVSLIKSQGDPYKAIAKAASDFGITVEADDVKGLFGDIGIDTSNKIYYPGERDLISTNLQRLEGAQEDPVGIRKSINSLFKTFFKEIDEKNSNSSKGFAYTIVDNEGIPVSINRISTSVENYLDGLNTGGVRRSKDVEVVSAIYKGIMSLTDDIAATSMYLRSQGLSPEILTGLNRAFSGNKRNMFFADDLMKFHEHRNKSFLMPRINMDGLGLPRSLRYTGAEEISIRDC